jgi:hypothetical protein
MSTVSRPFLAGKKNIRISDSSEEAGKKVGEYLLPSVLSDSVPKYMFP